MTEPVLATSDPVNAVSPAPAIIGGWPGERGYLVAASVGVRVAGMPVAVLGRLCFTRTWTLVDEMVATSAWLASEGASLSDALYQVIGEHRGSPITPLLVALRRAVFADRRPDRRTLAGEVMRTLPDDLAQRITAWTVARTRRESGLTRLTGVLATETTEKSGVLREAVDTDGFRRGLGLASPVLSGALDAWLAKPAGSIPGRQLRTRLAKYLARVAAKTSPYGTFAVSGFGGWSPDGPAVSPTQDLSARISRELDHRIIDTLWRRLVRRPEVRERVRLRVNPTATDDGERIWFLGADPAEPLSSVSSTGSVRRVLELVRAQPRLTLRDLRRWQAETGAGRGNGAGTGRGLDRLLEAGLLEPVVPYSEQASDPLPALLTWLNETLPELPERDLVWKQLSELPAAVRVDPVTVDAPDPEGKTRDIRDRLAVCLVELGQAPPGLPDRNPVIEDSLLPNPAVTCSIPAWRSACDDLDTVRVFLGLFDPDLPVKVAAAGYFRQRFRHQRTVPVLEFYRDVFAGGEPGTQREVLAGLVRAMLPASVGTLLGSQLPVLRELGELRQRVWDRLGCGPEAGAAVVRIAPATLDRMAASWPRFVRPPGSVCCYVQPVAEGSSLRLVLNLVTAGYGRGLTRLRRLVGQVNGDAPPVTDFRAGADGVLVAECRGMLGSGLNVRPATADVALDYPLAGDPDLPSLAFTELRAGYDSATDRIVLYGPEGELIRPVHLGMLAEYWLPPALRFLVRVFGEPPVAMPPGWAFRTSRSRLSAGAVQRWPRLDVGRVTVTRAGWRLWAGTFPVPGAGERDAAYLPRLAGWLAEHHIPRQFFARVVRFDRHALDGGVLGKARKPFFVDVTNMFLLDHLARLAAAAPEALMVLEEVLPDLSSAPSYGSWGSRVTECVVQLSAGPDSGNRRG